MYIKHKLYEEDVLCVANENLPWDNFKNKSLLLTGATGLIGTMIVDVLMQKNFSDDLNVKIYAIGRNEKIAKERFNDYFSNKNFEFIRLDVNSPFSFDFNVDYIIHAASNAQNTLYASDPVGTMMSNIFGTHYLFEYGMKSKIKRFIFISSGEIYGQALDGKDVFDEDYCGYINCNSLRAGFTESKRAGEALCNAYINQYNMDAVIVRPVRIYGPTMRLDDTKAMSQFIMNGVNREDIVLKSKGLPQFSFCYLADTVSGIFYCLFNGKCGEAYNVSDSSNILSLREIAEYVANLADREVVFEIPDEVQSKGFSKVVRGVMSNQKLQTLGWKPYDDIHSGIRKTIEILSSFVK